VLLGGKSNAIEYHAGKFREILQGLPDYRRAAACAHVWTTYMGAQGGAWPPGGGGGDATRIAAGGHRRQQTGRRVSSHVVDGADQQPDVHGVGVVEQGGNLLCGAGGGTTCSMRRMDDER
jgi:hypothetical protein